MARGKPKEWINAGMSGSPGDGVEITSTHISIASLPHLEGCKVLRCVGELSVRTDFVGSDATPNCWYFGVIGVNEDADTAGNVPDPGADFDAPWIMYLSGALVDDASKTTLGTYVSHRFDVKSNRRLRREDNLVGIFENQTGSLCHFDVHGRILIEYS